MDTVFQLTEESVGEFAEKIKDKKVVMIGEATHGTSEFYLWRAQLSRYLIEHHGFNFVAVEGNWPECYEVNRYVKKFEGSMETGFGVLNSFFKWPTWMWANWETVAFVEWLRKFNNEQNKRVGFYGLDVYSLWESLEEVMRYLRETDPEGYIVAKKAFSCFGSIGFEGQEYAMGTRLTQRECINEVVQLLQMMRGKSVVYDDDEQAFNAQQNALVLKNAEKYYRTMVQSDSESWNVRDTHMFETLQALMEHHGEGAKGIVWEHNTHIGDARATDMVNEGMINIGQLARQHSSSDTVLVGFGTHHGTVIASSEWGAPMEVVQVPSAQCSSWEDFIYGQWGAEDLIIPDIHKDPHFGQMKGHRAIGVVYNPQFERFGNYVPTHLSQRYDAFMYIHQTNALHPLHLSTEKPKGYPWFFQ